MSVVDRSQRGGSIITCACGRRFRHRSVFRPHARRCTEERQRIAACLSAMQDGDWSQYSATYPEGRS